MTTSDGVTDVDGAAAAARAQSRVLIGVQAVFWGGYLIALLLLGVAMLKNGGLTFWPFVNSSLMVDPKDVLGLGVAGYILHTPLVLLVVFGAPGASIAALAGMGLLAFSPAHRTRRLNISTALTLACAGAQLTPFGSRMVSWMLD